MDLSGLNDLRRILHEAKQFYTVWDYFLTHFGEKEDFFSHGEPVGQDELIQMVLKEVCKQLFSEPLILVQARLIRIPEYHFIHGSLMLDDQPANILYYDDIHKGMLCVPWKETSEVKYIRFTGRALYDGLNRSSN